MVYCTNCGTKNEEATLHCVKCGAKLVSKEETWDKRMEKWGEEFGKRAEEWGKDFGRRTDRGCFGLPYGGVIFGLLIGVIVILVGVTALLTEVDVARFFWPLVLVVFGLLIATGALYRLTRRR
jgi:uncharacterized membrane protein YvbJ